MLNMDEAQFDRVLVDECKAVADDLRAYIEARKGSLGPGA